MARVNFTYDYPYCGYGDTGRFKCHWSDSQIKINGNYTHPMIFNSTVPICNHLKVYIEITNTGSGTVMGISWDFMVYRLNYGWTTLQTFTLPDDGKYTIDCDVPNYGITQFLVVPSYRQSTSRTWENWYRIDSLTVTESLEANEPATGVFQYGVFTNRSGLKNELTEVYVNIGGTLKQATDILVDNGVTLVSIAPVYSAYLKTEQECLTLYKFIPQSDGNYKIQVKRQSGDHEIRFYNSEFSPLYEGYFYNRSFSLTEGSVYYITLTHYYSADESESYLQIYKEV